MLICLSGAKKEMGRKEGEVEEMIDARVRIEQGVDIYGPFSGLDCHSLGGSLFWL